MTIYPSDLYCDGSLQKKVNFRVSVEDHWHLSAAAEENNRSLSAHLRHLAIESLDVPWRRSQTSEDTGFNPSPAFDEYLATALSLAIVLGANASGQHEAKVRLMTQEIMQTLRKPRGF